jgi:peroxiredoxin
MALDLYDLIDHGAQLLGWSTDTPEHQQRMADDLMLLADLVGAGRQGQSFAPPGAGL